MKRGKDALFAWCKAVTAGYRGVEIKDFHLSWRDGLAFCAIIHRYRPDLINFNSLNKDEPLKNHELAFSVAENLGIPPLLDPEDMLVAPTPEPLSVMTYLSQFFHYFSGQKGAGIAVISHTEDTSPSAFAFSRPDGNSSTPAPAAGPAKNTTSVNNTAPPRTTSNAPPPSRDTRTESTATRPTATPTIPKINTALNKPEAQVGSKSPRLSHGGSIADTEAPVCQKCSKQVSGQTIEWMGNLYHKECFGCTTCNKAFRNNCLNIDGKPYCEGCGRKAFIASKLAKRGGDTGTTSSSATSTSKQETSTAPASKPSTTVDTRTASTSVSTNVPPRTVSGSVSSVPRTGSNVGSTSTGAPNRPLNIIEQEALREQEREKERELERQRLAGKSVGEAERKKREEEERKKREEEEKRKREEEDKKKREAEEKRRREEEDKRKTMEDERKKREELDRKRREDEEKRKTQENEAAKRREEERKKREEDDRKRALEEEKRRKEAEEARKRRELEEEENRKRAQAEEDRRRKTLEEETRKRDESTTARPRFVTASQATPEPPQNEANKVLQAIEEARRKKKAEEEEKRRQREEQRLKAAEEEQRRRADTIRVREEERKKREEEDSLRRELEEAKRATSGSVVSPRKPTATSETELQRKAREEEEERERIQKQLELKNQEIMRLNEENEREAARLRERRLSRNTTKSSGSFEREKAEQSKIEAAIQARKQSELKPVLGTWGDSTSRDSSVPEWQLRAKSVQEKYRTNSELPTVNNNYSNASNNSNNQDMNYFKAKKYDNDLDEEFDRKMNKRQTRVRNFVWEDFLESNKLKGFMMKRDPNGIFGGKWRRRYFVLREARLLYYRQEPPASSVGMNHPPLGIISLQYSSAIEPEGNGKIKIVTPDRVWRLDAGNNQEREKWIKGLREAKEIYTLVKNKIDEENVPIYGPNYEARKEGILQRYNAIYFWVDNYFTLQDGILFYFASKGANQKGRVPLYDAKFEEYSVTNKFSFKIVWKENGKKNEIILAAKSEEEMQTWCTALMKQKLLIEDTINSIEF
jgi:hypothetical protein